MSTLPTSLQDHLLQLGSANCTQHANAIVQEYYQLYNAQEAGQELWNLLVAALTNGQAANMHLAEERKELIHFYELTLALLKAVELLNKEGAA